MCKEQSKSLHSRYNPQGEADRYINSLSLNGNIRFFVLIEPGLGYLIAPLRKKAPSAKLIALHAEKHNFHDIEGPDSQWYPELGISIRDFLENEIPDCEASEVQLLEWRPALNIYGKAYLSLMEEAVDFIKRADANARTIKTFGNRWFRNFLKNLKLINHVLKPVSLNLPFIVTGAGPSLEVQIPIIKKQKRENIFILAASSSRAALKAAAITPDMVIATDGTPWAALHLFESLRGNFSSPLAVSLSASLPSQCENLPLLPICDQSLWQTIVFKELGLPFISLPQRGTVSASALDLAFTLTNNKVFIGGMDLANHDIRSHARPYSFDKLLEDKEKRFNPVYSQKYKRSSMLKAGGSFDIYASWFKKQLEIYPKRLYSLGENNSVFESLRIDRNVEFGIRNEPPGIKFDIIDIDSGACLASKAISILEKGLKDSVHSAIMLEELSPLLLPAGTSPSPEALIEALHAI